MKNGMYKDEHNNQTWYQNDVIHRIDGPAVVFANGGQAWYLNGYRLNSFEVYDWMQDCDVKNIPFSEEQSVLFAMTFLNHTNPTSAGWFSANT